MKWLLAAIGTMILWGFWGVAARKATMLSNSWYQVYVASNLAALFVITVLVIRKGRAALPPGAQGFGWALIAGIAGTVGYILFILAMELGGKASIVVPLTALYPAVGAIFAVLLLKETLTSTQLAGIVLAVISVILLSR